jgi:hypothetical protein
MSFRDWGDGLGLSFRVPDALSTSSLCTLAVVFLSGCFLFGSALFAQTAGPTDFFLHGSGGTANPPTLFLDNIAPTGTTAKYKDSTAVNFSGGNPWKEIGTWTAAPALTVGNLQSLTDLHVWLGLKNSDDQGTQFDLRAELYENNLLIAEGQTLCITGITRNPSNAKEATVTFGLLSSVGFDGTVDTLSLKIWTRIGTNADGTKCSGPGGSHNNAVGLRLYFDAVGREARFGAALAAGKTQRHRRLGA